MVSAKVWKYSGDIAYLVCRFLRRYPLKREPFNRSFTVTIEWGVHMNYVSNE